MSHYRKINACFLAFFTMCACLFAALHEYETALAMAPMWFLSRATMSFADVLYTFFTERPLFAAEGPLSEENPTGQRNWRAAPGMSVNRGRATN